MATITNTATAQTAPGRSTLSLASFARDDNVVAFTVGDVISDSDADAKCIKFPDCGRSGVITKATLVQESDDADDMELMLFTAEPTNHLDNSPLALVTADYAKLLGVIGFLTANRIDMAIAGTAHFHGATLNVDGTNELAFTSADGSLYGLLVNRTGGAMTASAKYHIMLHIKQDQK
jgi:hypothetical protein